MSFTHLQVRSGYSFMNSTLTIEKLVSRAKELEFRALALTDEAVLYGAIPFYKACKEAGIKPIIGMVIQVTNESDLPLTELTLLAKNEQGYKNIIKLSTVIQLAEEQIIDHMTLSNYTGDLIAIFPVTDQTLTQKLENSIFQEVKTYMSHYEKMFDQGDFYFGIEEQGGKEELLKNYVNSFPTPVVAINDVRYLAAKDGESFDCLQAMKYNKTWKPASTRVEYASNHLKTATEMESAFQHFWPEAIKKTAEIAAKCQLSFDFTKRLLPAFPLEAGVDSNTYLKQACFEQVVNKYGAVTKEISERLSYELATIQTMQFSDYFLITADIVRFAKDKGIMVGPGRGSSAGSLVAYVLGITDVDPLKYNLLFERFLNPERQTMPDIDIDFSDERRDEVIDYVREKYGQDHVAQIITFGTFAPRSLLRELMKTIDVSEHNQKFILNEMARSTTYNSLKEMVQASNDLREAIKASEELRLLFKIAVTLEGIPRHQSTHAAGVVISESPLNEHVPLTKGTSETYLTQYAMYDLESLGLLKMDFLGLKNLSFIERVVQSIRSREQPNFTLEMIPEQDAKTFALLQKGQTNGVFQLESAGMKRVLKQLQPTDFEDIIAVNALYRPGPIDFIPTYIARKHGKENVTYPHPNLQSILEPTYGVLVYQEQIMHIAKNIAGLTLGEADILRRAVSKKNPHIMQEQKQVFIEGCQRNGYQVETAEEIFSWIVRFSNYGFPRSHAVAYSKISYQLSYLKAHFPTHFFVEMMMNIRNQNEKMQEYINEMQGFGIELLQPTINKSFGRFTVENNHIRIGFYQIQGINRDIVNEIIHVRKEKPFQNIFDFCLRVSLDIVKRKAIENLIIAGVFDETEPNRASLLASLDQALDQAELFKDFLEQPNLIQDQIEIVEKYVDIDDFSIMKKLQDEKELIGMYVSSHPLTNYRQALRANGYVALSDAPQIIGKRNMQSVAIVQNIKQVRTKRGEHMAFVVLNDELLTMEAVLFPEAYRKLKKVIATEVPVVFTGKVAERNDQLQWIIDDAKLFTVDLLEEEPQQLVYIRITSETHDKALDMIREIANKHPGSTVIIIHEAETKQSYKLSVNFNLHVKPQVLKELQLFFGRKNVVLKPKKA